MKDEKARSILKILLTTLTAAILALAGLLGLCISLQAQEAPDIPQLVTRAEQGHLEDQRKLGAGI